MIKVIHSVEVSGRNRNMSLETGGKALLVTKWQRAQLNSDPVLVFCGRQKTVSHEKQIFGFKEISKQNVKGAAWFPLNAYNKIQKERNDLR